MGGDPRTSDWRVLVGRDITRYADLTLDRYVEMVRQDIESATAEQTRRNIEALSTDHEGANWTSVARFQGMNPARAIEELQRLKTEAESPDVQRYGPAHDEWKAKVHAVMARALGRDAAVLDNFDNVSYSVGIWTGSPGEDQRDAEYFAAAVLKAVAYIDAAIFELQLDADPETAPAAVPAAAMEGSTIFLVHGHDHGLKETVARFLERVTEAKIVILHEQPDRSQTIIEKFEAHAETAVFAVVLLTPDDYAIPRNDEKAEAVTTARARQNVIFEWGYFVGRLGRSRVLALHNERVELPSDIDGVLYKRLDESGAWRIQVAKELQAAGLQIDTTKLLD